MNALILVSTCVLFATLFVLGQESSLEFEDRWIERPPGYRRFPSSVYIRMTSASDGFCTGTLLDYRWVLTASRCMYKGTEKVVESDTSLTVYARVDDRSKLDAKGVQKRSSVMLRFHQNTYHSLALIKLVTPFNKDNSTVPVSVTTEGVINVEDSICNSGSYGNKPNDTTIKYMYFDLKNCKCHQELKDHFPMELKDKWICGQFKVPVKLCPGDFGLGLICDGVLQAVVIGVVVFEDEKSCKIIEESPICDDHNSMGLFVDVCYYIEWIRMFVPAIEEATARCDSRSDATPATASTNWGMYSFLLLITNLYKKYVV